MGDAVLYAQLLILLGNFVRHLVLCACMRGRRVRKEFRAECRDAVGSVVDQRLWLAVWARGRRGCACAASGVRRAAAALRHLRGLGGVRERRVGL